MRTFRLIVNQESAGKTYESLLAQASRLSPEVLADAALKGAIWLQSRSRGKTLRIRKLLEKSNIQDNLIFYFDPKVLAFPELNEAECVGIFPNYSVWLKKAGVMAQGTQTGDHTSLLRLVEKKMGREVFLVHRLDRETEGLMIVAHNSKAAATLSEYFQKNMIIKTYQAIVLGELKPGTSKQIRDSLDGKEAITNFKVLASDRGHSLLELKIDTGRFHQIRRHLDGLGHPVIGDPLYGKGNKNREGLRLLAKSLEFKDPWTHEMRLFQTASSLSLSHS